MDDGNALCISAGFLMGGGTSSTAKASPTVDFAIVDNAVFSTISDVVHSALTSGTVRYDLVQHGVRLAPFHETDPSVPQSVRDTLAQVEQDIIQGTIDVSNTCRNRVYLPVALRNP